MLLTLIILSALGFAIVNIEFHKARLRPWLDLLFLVLLIGSVGLLIGNDKGHWGMTTRTTTTRQSLTTTADLPGANLLLYQPLGNGHEKIFIYKTSAQQKKPLTTSADVRTTSNVTRTKEKQAQLVTKTQRYVYRNGFYRFLYAGLGNNNAFKSRQHNFKVGQIWVVLSTKQAKKMQKAAKASQAQLKQQLASAVKAKMQAALKQNPQLTAAQQQALQKQFAAAAKAQAQQQLLQKLQQASLK